MFAELAFNYLRNRKGHSEQSCRIPWEQKQTEASQNHQEQDRSSPQGSLSEDAQDGERDGGFFSKCNEKVGSRYESSCIFRLEWQERRRKMGGKSGLFSSNIFPFHPVLSHFRGISTQDLETVKWNVLVKSFPLLAMPHPLLLEPQASHECSPNH